MLDDEFEWDDRKARRNVQAHGVTFELARLVFDDPNEIDWLDLDGHLLIANDPFTDRGPGRRRPARGLLRPARRTQAHHLGAEGHVS